MALLEWIVVAQLINSIKQTCNYTHNLFYYYKAYSFHYGMCFLFDVIPKINSDYNPKQIQPNSVKLSEAMSRIRYLNSERTSFSRTYCVLVNKELIM